MIWVLLLLVFYILALLGVAWFSLHPFRTPAFISPGAMGCNQEDVSFTTSDGVTLRGWWVNGSDLGTVAVLAHGYMMNRCELTPLGVRLAQEGCSFLVFDLRAHGKSGGKKCTLGPKEALDVAAAVQFAKERSPSAKVVLIGSSMGAAASAFALGADSSLADVLILDSAYSRLSNAVAGWWRFLGGQALSFVLTPSVIIAAPLAGINPFKVDVTDSLRKITKPVLILHGDCDNLATPGEALRNEAACAGPVQLVWFSTCGHSEGRWVHPDLYYRTILVFLEEMTILPSSVSGLSS